MGTRLESLRRALRSTPNDLQLLLEFARQAILEQEPKIAEDAYRQALVLDAHAVDAHLGLAESLFVQGKASEAAVRIENLLNERPGLARALLLLARVALREGDRNEAQAQWRRAQRAEPGLRDEELEREFGSSPPRALGRVTHEGVNWSEHEEEDDDEEEEFEEGFQLEDFDKPRATLTELYGLESQARLLKRLLEVPSTKMLDALSGRPRGGVLLYGPPGCGKSFLAEAVAGSAQVPFLAIGLHQLLDSYVGNAEKNLHDLFVLANSRGPCVLLIDELDAIASERGQQRFTPVRTLLSQLLFELDRLDPKSGSLIIGATSSPWDIDGALLRAGRLGRSLFVGPLSERGRAQMLEDEIVAQHPEFLPCESELATRQLQALVEATRGFAPADVRQLTLEWIALNQEQEGEQVPEIAHLLESALRHHSEVSSWCEVAHAAFREAKPGVRRRFLDLVNWLERLHPQG